MFHGNIARGDVATLLPLARLRNLAIVHCRGLSGTLTGPVVRFFGRFISDIRKKHGHDAVRLAGCGRFDLADNLSGIADIAHIDLSSRHRPVKHRAFLAATPASLVALWYFSTAQTLRSSWATKPVSLATRRPSSELYPSAASLCRGTITPAPSWLSRSCHRGLSVHHQC